jgi:hypothetical protein
MQEVHCTRWHGGAHVYCQNVFPYKYFCDSAKTLLEEIQHEFFNKQNIRYLACENPH